MFSSAFQQLVSQPWHKLITPWPYLTFLWAIPYICFQYLIAAVFKPSPPRPKRRPFGKIAVIGAGITGISSAAHAVAHNFDVTIFEQRSEQGLGGIWAHVNATSALQLNSILYRFFPSVIWTQSFPSRHEILVQARKVWKEYGLKDRTQFNARVVRVTRKEGVQHQRAPTKPAPHGNWMVHIQTESTDKEEVYGPFDAIIVTIGTCGEPKWIEMEGMPDHISEKAHPHKREETSTTESYADIAREWTEHERDPSRDSHVKSGESFASAVKEGEAAGAGKPVVEEVHHEKHSHLGESELKEWPSLEEKGKDKETGQYEGPILHSSELDKEEVSDSQVKGKTVVIVGSGASAVEAAETALAKGAKQAVVIARSDKWIIPRNLIISTLIACQPFGRQMPLSFLWEAFIRYFHYRSARDLCPADLGLFEGTPIVNDEFLDHVRKRSCRYVRGDPERLTPKGIRVNVRQRGTKHGDQGTPEEIQADMIVLATGFNRPDLGFLPKDELFPEGYERPNLYLQNFSTEDWSILMTNSSYQNAIGTVGHFHIGIYTRILLALLLDESARPTPKDMKLWVDVVSFLKRGAKGGAFSFFTYAELTIWLIGFHVLKPGRTRWLPFIMFGWGEYANDRIGLGPVPRSLAYRLKKTLSGKRRVHGIDVHVDPKVLGSR